MKTFSEFTNQTRKLNEESELQEKYRGFFLALLNKYGVTTPADLDEDEMKKFFGEITLNWERGKGLRNDGQQIVDEYGK